MPSNDEKEMENNNNNNTTKTNATAGYKGQSQKTLACALAECFETGHVPIYKYPEKFHKAI